RRNAESFSPDKKVRCNPPETKYALAYDQSKGRSGRRFRLYRGRTGAAAFEAPRGGSGRSYFTAMGRQDHCRGFPPLHAREKRNHPEILRFECQSDCGRGERGFSGAAAWPAAEFAKPLLEAGARVLDLSADFRLKDENVYQEYYGQSHPLPNLLPRSVYGLPELHREQIRQAQLVACPGCYPTSILIPLRPLIRRKALDRKTIVVTSMSGVTGAGRKAEADYLFSECNESVRPYGVPKHRHLSEIEQELSILAEEKVVIQFTPHLVPINRGILTTICANIASNVVNMDAPVVFKSAYGEEPFVRLLGDGRLPDTKNVAGTNFIDIAWKIDKRTNRIVLMSAI